MSLSQLKNYLHTHDRWVGLDELCQISSLMPEVVEAMLWIMEGKGTLITQEKTKLCSSCVLGCQTRRFYRWRSSASLSPSG